jgi:hypothetical protein
MSALEAISSSINRMVEYQLRSPEDKATAATVMGVTLSIPMDMADKRAAQATAVGSRLEAVNLKIATARESYSSVVASNNAGAIDSWAVTAAEEDLQDLIDERTHLRNIKKQLQRFSENQMEVINDIQDSAK